ncbi:Detected protein of unknown function [Hibiscus syriacus]|uniref:Uncharacterized protein n=1 Tax=Hibiscus syriacus TaxID=106335 RepID=A0A6A2ZRN2_HIBSY|nr:Detected protein of unknown function [Hibiscus syriacus]
MKDSKKDSEMVWDQIPMRSSSGNTLVSGHPTRPIPKLMVLLIISVVFTYIVYTLSLLTTSAQRTMEDTPFTSMLHPNKTSFPSPPLVLNQKAVISPPNLGRRDVLEKQVVAMEMRPKPTQIQHVVFGIAASSKLWQQRKEYIKIWYKPDQMRGVVWLDDHVKYSADESKPFRRFESPATLRSSLTRTRRVTGRRCGKVKA